MKHFENTDLVEKQISSTSVFRGRLLDVYSDDIELPNGDKSKREYIRHVGAACVVPITDDGKVIIEYQYRYPVARVMTEIPAGKLNSKSEPPEEAVRRELLEETGITAGTLIYLGELIPTCAYSDEIIHMYVAKDLKYAERKLDDDEFLNLCEIPLEELVHEIMEGKIPDSKTQAAVLRAYLLEKGI